MTVSSVEYDLQQGFISNWLVAGPQEIPLGTDALITDPDTSKQQAARKYQTTKQEITNSPVERGPLTEGIFTIGDFKGEWNYFRCKNDRLVDLSGTFSNPAYVRAWAYTHIVWNQVTTVEFQITAWGPLDIWINKKHIFGYTEFPVQSVQLKFTASLEKGVNKLLVRIGNMAAPDALLAFRLQIIQGEGEGKINIPTLIPSIDRRSQLEWMFDQLYLERDIHAHNQTITLHFPQHLNAHASIDVRLQTTSGRIYGQAEEIGKPGSEVKLGTPASLPFTPFQVLIMPRAWELYESNIRITRRLNLWSVGSQRFSAIPYAHPEERKREALLFASSVEGSVFAEIAKIALGKWTELEEKYLKASFENIKQRRAGCEIELLGLLGLVSRFGQAVELPGWILEQTREAALQFSYAPHAFSQSTAENAARSDGEILFSACKILSGQLYPEAIFLDSGLSGALVKEEGESAALLWMEKRGLSGFACWDSKELYAQVLAALSYLIDLSAREEVWELASVLMDKMLFSIAVNSFNGVYGSPQGRAATVDILSGLLEPTSGITRVLWGMGIFNAHLAGTVSIACLNEYQLPPIIAEIAASKDEMLNKEQQAVGEHPVNKVTYRTADYMLSSAQSYRPGQPGHREHIWQATLGTQNTVFTNHPGCLNDNDVHAPNYWLGNGILPRAVQYKNTLFALYDLPASEIIDFTHAYFPSMDFDEFEVTATCAFARKDDGYIGLTALNGLELLTTGPTAYRELRSNGRQNIWICQMGSSTVDGSFSAFKEAIQHQQIRSSNLAIELKTENGDILSFGWEAPLLYNGKEQAINNFLHFDNPFASAVLPCYEIAIANNDYSLRLTFGNAAKE
jgi:hypothetical protein